MVVQNLCSQGIDLRFGLTPKDFRNTSVQVLENPPQGTRPFRFLSVLKIIDIGRRTHCLILSITVNTDNRPDLGVTKSLSLEWFVEIQKHFQGGGPGQHASSLNPPENTLNGLEHPGACDLNPPEGTTVFSILALSCMLLISQVSGQSNGVKTTQKVGCF